MWKPSRIHFHLSLKKNTSGAKAIITDQNLKDRTLLSSHRIPSVIWKMTAMECELDWNILEGDVAGSHCEQDRVVDNCCRSCFYEKSFENWWERKSDRREGLGSSSPLKQLVNLKTWCVVLTGTSFQPPGSMYSSSGMILKRPGTGRLLYVESISRLKSLQRTEDNIWRLGTSEQ